MTNRIKGLVFSALAAAALSASGAASASDWPMFMNDAANSGCASAPVNLPLAPKWSFDAGAKIVASPVKAADKVFIATRDGVLFSLNAYTGELIWRYEAGARISAAPAAADGRVFISSLDGVAHGIDAATGNVVWRHSTGGMNAGSPTVERGRVFIGSGHPHNSVIALDAATGALLWRYAVGQPVLSTPAVADAALWVGAGDGAFHGLNPDTGAPFAVVRTRGLIYSASPSMLAGVAFGAAGEFDKNVYAFSTGDGAHKWTASPVPGDSQVKVSSVSSCGGRAFISIGYPDQKVAAFDAASGGVLWIQNAGSAEGKNFHPSPVVAGNIVFAASADGALRAFDSASGSALASLSIGSSISATPAVADGMIFVASYDGAVSAYFGADAAPPVVSLSGPTPNQLTGGEIVISGTVSDSNLERYAIEVGEGAAPESWTALDTVYGKNVSNGAIGVWSPASDLDSGVYSFRITAYDVAGNSASKTVSFRLDNAPPQFAGLESISLSDDGGSIILSWSPAADESAPLTYPIYMSEEPGGQNFSSPVRVAAGLSYELSGLASGTTYYVVVRAADAFGNEDSNTVELSAVPTKDTQSSGSPVAARLYIPRSGELVEVPGGEDALDSEGRKTILLVDSQNRTLISYTDTFLTSLKADGKDFVEISVNVYDVNGAQAPGIAVSVSGETRSMSGAAAASRAALSSPPPRTTNRLGRSVFQISSAQAGDFLIQADVDGHDYGPAFRVAYQAPPLSISEAHAYPNPWRPSVSSKLCFAGLMTGAPSSVIIRLFDIRGSLVREIFAPDADTGSLTPNGSYSNLACWDGTNNAGKPLASGVYLYNILASDGTERINITGKFSVAR